MTYAFSRFLLLLTVIFFNAQAMAEGTLPKGFVYLSTIDTHIHQDMKYAGNDNLIGRPFSGYNAPVCILTKKAAKALDAVQKQLHKEDLSLLMFDCYRPQTAVIDIENWSKNPSAQENKATFYPNVRKRDLFKLGYVAEKSGHTRGSTVDLTIVNDKTGTPLDMGTRHDFMGNLSHTGSENVTQEQHHNRMFLQHIMNLHGFVGINNEWWHFTLQHEPFPHTYFNFPVA